VEDIACDFLDAVSLFAEHETADASDSCVGYFSDQVKAFWGLLPDF